MHPLGKRGPAQRNPGVGQPLMLAIEREVIPQLVDSQPSQDTDIGETALQHRRRHGRTGQGSRLLALDDGPEVLEDDIRPGTLRQPLGDLLANHFILMGR